MYTSARIWHCKYKTLLPLTKLKNLKALKIATYPDSSFMCLGTLAQLEQLDITHLPHVRRLADLESLSKLRELRLATLPSWDSSDKVTTVDSLAPLTRLPSLERLELYGVVTESRSARELLTSTTLREVRLSKYSPESMCEIAQRYAA
jgi:hypothetical protein